MLCQYRGYTIPKGATVFVNTCEFFCHCPIHNFLTSGEGGMFHDPGSCCNRMSMTVKITTLCLDAFENPEVFDPGRYLITEHGTKPGVDDRCYRSTLAFGSGRVEF